jgi:IS5 family transposase
MTDDFFRNSLDQMIDLRYPLAVLDNRMPWQVIEASLAQCWARQVKAGKKIEDLDLFGPVFAMISGGVSNSVSPGPPTRLMVALLYLRHGFNESDEDVIKRWGETPTWQFFSGNVYFEQQWPCDPTQLWRFSRALGEEGVEELLARTMEVTVRLKLIANKDLTRVIVDSTVQEKTIAHPTESKLLEIARRQPQSCGQPRKALQLARTRGGIDQHRQKPQLVQIRREGRSGDDAQGQFDSGY